MLVVDASVTMAWCFEDEADDYADAALDALEHDDAIVPSVWPLEIVNVLVNAERHKRISVAKTTQFIGFLQGLPIQVDSGRATQTFEGVLNVARGEKLSAYDAAYLDLAIREDAPLATHDKTLRRIAKKLGVSMFEG